MAVDAERVAAIEGEAFRESFDGCDRRELSSVIGLDYLLDALLLELLCCIRTIGPKHFARVVTLVIMRLDSWKWS